MSSNDGDRSGSDGGNDEATAANIVITASTAAALAAASASASEALAVTEQAVAEATAATMRANRDRNHSTIAAASAAVAAAAASLEATEAVTAAMAAATRASASRDINQGSGSMMSSNDGGPTDSDDAVTVASTIASAATAAAEEEETENALLEEFLDAHAIWTDHVDKMMELEKWLLSERQHPPSILPKATWDDGVHPMQYICESLARDEMKNKVKRNDIEEGEGMNGDDDRNEVVSGFKDDEEKLQFTDAAYNSTTVTTSSASASSFPSLEELSKVLFQPGMQFKGRISIPGLVGIGGGRFSAENDEHEENEDEDYDEDEDDEDYDEDEDEVTMEEMDAVMSNGMFIMGQDFQNFMQHASSENDQEEEKEEAEEEGEAEEEEEAEDENIMEEEVEEENNNDNSIDDDMVSSFASLDNRASTNRECTHNTQEGSGGNPYELTIMQLGSDPLGNSFILAKHSAYEDEQVVHIQTNIVYVYEHQSEGSASTRRLEISYEDGETVCKGHWNPIKFRLEGHVYQRAITNDGVFRTSDSATHVFTLYPCTFCCLRERKGKEEATVPLDEMQQDLLSMNTRAIVAHRLRIQGLHLEALRKFLKLSNSLSLGIRHETIVSRKSLVRQREVIKKIRRCHWVGLIERYFLRSEEICAEFRRRALLLNNLSFESTNDQLRCIEQWKDAKMDLAAAHAEWDEWTGQIKGLILFDDDGLAIGRWLGAQRRIHVNFESLESAYQRASTRLPISDLAKYEIPSTVVREDLLGNTCIICQSPLLDEEDRVYELPCSHYFHKSCVQQWLHDNLSCPMCRFDLKSDEKKADR